MVNCKVNIILSCSFYLLLFANCSKGVNNEGGSGYSESAAGKSEFTGRVAGIENNGSLFAARGSADNAELENIQEELVENIFIEVADWNEFSHFPSTARNSWNILLNSVNSNFLPEPHEIQIHELLNYPEYIYDTLANQLGFIAEVTKSSWEPNDLAFFLGVRAPLDYAIYNPSWTTIFNTEIVESYRLLGQEDYMKVIEDSSAFIMENGISSQSIFQIKTKRKPIEGELIAESTLSFEIDEETHQMNLRAKYSNSNPTSDVQFGLCIAELGLLVRNSAFKGSANIDSVYNRLNKITHHNKSTLQALYLVSEIRTNFSFTD